MIYDKILNSNIMSYHAPPVDNEPVNEDEQADEDNLESLDELQLRRSTRERQPSTRYSFTEYMMITDGGEPEPYQEVMSHKKKLEWLGAMQDEMKSLHENHTYDLVKLPKGKRALKNKWVFRLNIEENSSQPRYKARLIVKGFNQKKRVLTLKKFFL